LEEAILSVFGKMFGLVFQGSSLFSLGYSPFFQDRMSWCHTWVHIVNMGFGNGISPGGGLHFLGKKDRYLIS
jgi:hypothetical protein